MVKRMVLVGHCGADTAMLSHALSLAVKDVPVVSANDVRALEGYASTDSLLLINRVLDGRFGTGSGVELIAQIRARPEAPAMMLVSNYEDAQAKAVEAGALPGFGKADAYDPATAARLLEAAGGSASPSPVSS